MAASAEIAFAHRVLLPCFPFFLSFTLARYTRLAWFAPRARHGSDISGSRALTVVLMLMLVQFTLG
ncbi:hypothetical protein Dimus_007157 [Dionaea muscipula]